MPGAKPLSTVNLQKLLTYKQILSVQLRRREAAEIIKNSFQYYFISL